MKRSVLFAFAMIWITIMPSGVSAHGTDHRVLDQSPVIALAFFYSDQEPMRYAKVLVFSPENDAVEYQNGRTDKNGQFAFYPDRAGKWQIKVNDGMGHAEYATIDVKARGYAGDQLDPQAENEKTRAAEASMFMKICLGLSLLLNLFLGVYIRKTKKEGMKQP